MEYNYIEMRNFLKKINKTHEQMQKMWDFCVKHEHKLISKLSGYGMNWYNMNTSCLSTLEREYNKIKVSNIFGEVIKHHCSCSQDITDEYSSRFKVDFLLNEPTEFEVFGIKYIVDRIRMRNDYENWSEDVLLIFANDTTEFHGINIPKRLLRAFYRRLLKEQKKGILKGFCFDEDVSELYSKITV